MEATKFIWLRNMHVYRLHVIAFVLRISSKTLKQKVTHIIPRLCSDYHKPINFGNACSANAGSQGPPEHSTLYSARKHGIGWLSLSNCKNHRRSIKIRFGRVRICLWLRRHQTFQKTQVAIFCDWGLVCCGGVAAIWTWDKWRCLPTISYFLTIKAGRGYLWKDGIR